MGNTTNCANIHRIFIYSFLLWKMTNVAHRFAIPKNINVTINILKWNLTNQFSQHQIWKCYGCQANWNIWLFVKEARICIFEPKMCCTMLLYSVHCRRRRRRRHNGKKQYTTDRIDQCRVFTVFMNELGSFAFQANVLKVFTRKWKICDQRFPLWSYLNQMTICINLSYFIFSKHICCMHIN